MSRSFQIWLCPDKMSDGSEGTVQRAQSRGLPTLAGAKRILRETAKHPNSPEGYFWVADHRGVPLYGILVTREQKYEKVHHDERKTETGVYSGGWSMRPVKGETVRKLKPGNMPWNR